MMYLAPRQGLFAIIILVSFCLQTLLLVISTDQQLSKSRAHKGEQMVTQLIDEARLSLENKDRVSLSVIANRYTSEQDVARLVIKDSNNEILVPVGNAPMQKGNTIEQMATKGDAVIGSVALTLKDISKGEIIAMQWPFVIGSLLLHLLLLVAYGYIARPTKQQINALSREIDNLHRNTYAKTNSLDSRRQLNAADSRDADSKIYDSEDPNNQAPNSSANSISTKGKSTGTAVNTAVIHNELNAYLKSQQGTGSVEEQALASADTRSSATDTTINQLQKLPSKPQKPAIATNKLSASRSYDSVSVQVKFHDEYKMLERLAPEMRVPYLALCTQLFNQALLELLQLPLLLGVSVINEPHFEDNGAVALLKANNSHAKVALAGVMLGKLYLMLNKIIHDKHIELSKFALSVTVGVSDEAQSEAMAQLLKSVGKKEQMLILLPNEGLKQIANHVKVYSLKRPTTVYERECAVFEGGNDAMIQRLADVRNAVLMTGNE
ncbi:hypothetical protein KPY62_10390 [Psychrobacter sp. TAE2020]|uniref:hypothetical protein n=1 Tax=Psychrobacter sp. TAE2020 TaxID=2846762 RepID=UPI001C12843D|nr:hypothetical protein [Psychrobacter sp. TAE2020]MBU5617489.1 hypothetical protein [Psychrobacter sp. TAE2020]